MERSEFKLEFIKELEKKGIDPDDRIVNLALDKCARWQKLAYGGIDWQEFADESGFDQSYYYNESLNGIENTFLRENRKN